MSAWRALVIDDEEDMREIARVFLELDGKFEVRVATSGEAGVEIARRERPDVILLDYMMPGMDGPATIQELARDPATADIPVIFLTAKSHPGVEQALMHSGARDVISKPFDPVALAGRVAAALGAG